MVRSSNPLEFRMETIQELVDYEKISDRLGCYNLLLSVMEEYATKLKDSLDGFIDDDPIKLAKCIHKSFVGAFMIYQKTDDYEGNIGLVKLAEARCKAAFKPLFPQLTYYPNIMDLLNTD